MRQIGTLDSEHDARRVEDYLLTQGITARVEPEPPGWALWIEDEDKVAQSREALAEFLRNPADERYTAAHDAAQQLREQEEQLEKQYRRRAVNLGNRYHYGTRPPLTLTLLAVCILVALGSQFGANKEPILVHLTILPIEVKGARILYEPANPLFQKQIWRVFTPMLIHWNFLHLLFNMIWLYQLGGQIETRLKSWRLGLLVLATGAAAHLGEYAWSQAVLMGGMSGVVYGLLGYTWVFSRYDLERRLFLPPGTMSWMMAWLFLCMTGWVGEVANAAHVVGLLAGSLLGFVAVGIARRSGE